RSEPPASSSSTEAVVPGTEVAATSLKEKAASIVGAAHDLDTKEPASSAKLSSHVDAGAKDRIALPSFCSSKDLQATGPLQIQNNTAAGATRLERTSRRRVSQPLRVGDDGQQGLKERETLANDGSREIASAEMTLSAESRSPVALFRQAGGVPLDLRAPSGRLSAIP
ncbi:unnamed protein product, partial [Amoebophrya sp. A25]